VKHLNVLLLGCLIGMVSGCASQPAVLSPVGPPPLDRPSGAPDAGLSVFSAGDFGTPGDELAQYHSGYWLYAADGKRLKYINNRAGSQGREPARVSLPPGRYKVLARAAAFGIVTVPVVLEAGKTTFVHLDGSELTGASRTATAEFVSLPDGLIIGWRAKDEP
jgi:hypothetical protein